MQYKPLLALILSLFVHPQSFAETSVESSRFQTMKEWYEAGVATTWPEIQGAWAGRCFETWSPNLPLNILATSFSVRTGGDAGPGFPDEFIPYMGLLVQQDKMGRALPADFFDMAPPHVIRHSRDVNYSFSRQNRLWPLWEGEDSVGWEIDHENDGYADLLFSARKHETYWVLRISVRQAHQMVFSYALGQQRRVPTRNAHAYCYFFENFEALPVTPEP